MRSHGPHGAKYGPGWEVAIHVQVALVELSGAQHLAFTENSAGR